MKTIFKMLLVLIAIGLTFATVSIFFWCVGSLLLLVNVDLLPHHVDVYTFGEIVIVGGWHLLLLIVVVELKQKIK